MDSMDQTDSIQYYYLKLWQHKTSTWVETKHQVCEKSSIIIQKFQLSLVLIFVYREVLKTWKFTAQHLTSLAVNYSGITVLMETCRLKLTEGFPPLNFS